MVILIFTFVALGVMGVIGYFTVRWNNPYKLIFLFGKKGSGKTTLLIRYMTEYHKKGYSVYTNMKTCSLPYVQVINVDDLGYYVAKPKSMIALDEVGTIYDARKFKTFKDETRDYFKYQRQYKNVVVMTSQSWDVDKKIRDLTDTFYLCGKIGPISYARQIVRQITLTEPMGDSESRIADQLKFKPLSVKVCWIPKWSKLYESFAPPERPFFVDPPELPNEEIRRRISSRKKRKR